MGVLTEERKKLLAKSMAGLIAGKSFYCDWCNGLIGSIHFRTLQQQDACTQECRELLEQDHIDKQKSKNKEKGMKKDVKKSPKDEEKKKKKDEEVEDETPEPEEDEEEESDDEPKKKKKSKGDEEDEEEEPKSKKKKAKDEEDESEDESEDVEDDEKDDSSKKKKKAKDEDEDEEEEEDVKSKKKAKDKDEKPAKKKAASSGKKPIKKPYQYREGSVIKKLFDRLTDGKWHVKAELFKGLKGPDQPLARIKIHAERFGWEWKEKGDQIKLVIPPGKGPKKAKDEEEE